jgi:hypothetical protein
MKKYGLIELTNELKRDLIAKLAYHYSTQGYIDDLDNWLTAEQLLTMIWNKEEGDCNE